MRGLFVNTTYNISQGRTDFGYYIDGDSIPGSGNDLENLVENDEAFFVEIFPVQNNGAHIRLSSENRRYSSEIKEEIGIRSHGLDETLYQKPGEPDLPRTYDSLEERNQSLATFARYALKHGKRKGLDGETDWDNLLEHGKEF